ncbi:hypothetical protein [Streptomyces sp. NPDC054783]
MWIDLLRDVACRLAAAEQRGERVGGVSVDLAQGLAEARIVRLRCCVREKKAVGTGLRRSMWAGVKNAAGSSGTGRPAAAW